MYATLPFYDHLHNNNRNYYGKYDMYTRNRSKGTSLFAYLQAFPCSVGREWWWAPAHQSSESGLNAAPLLSVSLARALDTSLVTINIASRRFLAELSFTFSTTPFCCTFRSDATRRRLSVKSLVVF